MTPEQRKTRLAVTIAVWSAIIGLGLVLTYAVLTPNRPSDAQIQRDITAYLQDFGNPPATSWYPSIKQVWVRGDTVIITTDLQTKNENAMGVCAAVSGFVFDNSRQYYGLNRVQILGFMTDSTGNIGGNNTLIYRQGRSDTCQ